MIRFSFSYLEMKIGFISIFTLSFYSSVNATDPKENRVIFSLSKSVTDQSFQAKSR